MIGGFYRLQITSPLPWFDTFLDLGYNKEDNKTLSTIGGKALKLAKK